MRPRGWQLSLLLLKYSARLVELCVCQDSPGLCFPGSGKEQTKVAVLGNSTLMQPCIVPGSCMSLGFAKGLHCLVEAINSLGNASTGVQTWTFFGVSNTSAIKALGLPMAIPMWWYPVGRKLTQVMSRLPGTNLMFQCQDFHRCLQAAVSRISPLQVSDWSWSSSLWLIHESVYAS